MIPDNVEKIVMTKQDYDRNVEQLLFDKVKAEQELERYKNIIDELGKDLQNLIKSSEEVENKWASEICIFVLNKLKELKGSDN